MARIKIRMAYILVCLLSMVTTVAYGSADPLEKMIEEYRKMHESVYSYVNEEDYYLEDGVLYSGNALLWYPEWKPDKTFKIPEHVVYVGSCAFSGNAYIEAVFAPDGLMVIDDAAFNYCTNLSRFSAGKNLLIIGSNAFGDCWALKEFVLPQGLYFIGNHAFSWTRNLQSCILPSSLKHIGDGAFAQSAITHLDFSNNLTIEYIGSYLLGTDLSQENVDVYLPYDCWAYVAFNDYYSVDGCITIHYIDEYGQLLDDL